MFLNNILLLCLTIYIEMVSGVRTTAYGLTALMILYATTMVARVHFQQLTKEPFHDPPIKWASSAEKRQNEESHAQNRNIEHDKEVIRIVWYNPPVHIQRRPHLLFGGFDGCAFSNCRMSFNKVNAKSSDAVIFTARSFPKQLTFSRPVGQIWVFHEHEPPYRYSELGNMWNQSNVFNWTMTYDNDIADIHIPYGEIQKKSKQPNPDFDEIMRRKNKTALVIMSHCKTPSKRLQYVDKLKRYFNVDVLGNCGAKWHCGQRYVHDDCFEIINEYRYYLAFENSFCNNYFTEKIFDNFDYDSVLISRGGKTGQIKDILPDGTYISTGDFENADQLGTYLQTSTDEDYINILRKKNLYTALNSYATVFRRALCDLCRKMNFKHVFSKTIDNIDKLIFSSRPCIPASDMK